MKFAEAILRAETYEAVFFVAGIVLAAVALIIFLQDLDKKTTDYNENLGSNLWTSFTNWLGTTFSGNDMTDYGS